MWVERKDLRLLVSFCMLNEIYVNFDGVIMFDINVNLFENIRIWLYNLDIFLEI